MSSKTDLAARLQATFLPAGDVDTDPPQSTPDRILDAASRRFAAAGVKATTMSSIATEAEISREWLYRNFSNKDAVLTAVVHRELQRFIDGLAASVEWNHDAAEMLTDAFVYCVEFLADRPLLREVMDQGTEVRPDEMRARSGAIVTLATRSCAGYLVDLGGFDRNRAAAIAETLVRLVGSTVLVPAAELDLRDPTVLRDYAGRVVPAVVRGC